MALHGCPQEGPPPAFRFQHPEDPQQILPLRQTLNTLFNSAKKIHGSKILFIIHSLGGDPLAAERMIKVLNEYSHNDYWVLVAGIAKSAATTICLGASKIILAPTSELGPIDLQIARGNGLIPAHSIITAYDKLIEKGINLGQEQRIEPILQQLQGYYSSEIEYYRQVNELSSDIAVKVLKNVMMKDMNEKEIKDLINIFLDPSQSKTHGRPIYYSDIKEIDPLGKFNVELIPIDGNIWSTIKEYHTRITTHLTVTDVVKILESDEMIFKAAGGR